MENLHLDTPILMTTLMANNGLRHTAYGIRYTAYGIRIKPCASHLTPHTPFLITKP